MIKVKVNNEYQDVVKIFCGGTLQKEIIKVWSREAQEYVYESSIEYTGSLPITITADGNALLDYRIYGADGGVGGKTENLIDANKPNVLQRVEVEPGENYCLSKYQRRGSNGRPEYTIYDENDNRLRFDYIDVWMAASFTIPDNGKYALITFGTNYTGLVSFAKGTSPTTAKPYPENYIPYGYRLPIISNRNLFDALVMKTYKPNYYKDNAGIERTYYGGGYFSYYIPIANERICVENIRGMDTNNPCRLYFYDSNMNWISHSDGYLTDFSIVPPIGAMYIQIQLGTRDAEFSSDIVITQDSNKITTPVYIGENQLDSVEGVSDYVDKASDKIVRMIGEYTFTGDESFNKYGNSDVFYTPKTIDPVGITTVNTITMRCDHPAFTVIENKDTRYWLNPEADDICCFLPGGMSQVFFRSTSNFTTAAECKAYLKAQYDNGTPVKINYWLKTPVEEDPPVSFPDIPTIKGETIIDYDGTPKPSQMYVKYRR